jgi:hypothetical protein
MLAGEAHADGECLRFVDLDVQAKWRLEPDGEQLDLLWLSEMDGVRQMGLEALLVVKDGACVLAGGQLAEGVRPEWGTEMEVGRLGEVLPLRLTLVTLHLDVPELRRCFKVVGGHPHLFLLHDALLMEVGLVAIAEDEGAGFPIELGEIQLLEVRRPLAVAPA